MKFNSVGTGVRVTFLCKGIQGLQDSFFDCKELSLYWRANVLRKQLWSVNEFEIQTVWEIKQKPRAFPQRLGNEVENRIVHLESVLSTVTRRRVSLSLEPLNTCLQRFWVRKVKWELVFVPPISKHFKPYLSSTQITWQYAFNLFTHSCGSIFPKFLAC